jgi:hypothetical protein
MRRVEDGKWNNGAETHEQAVVETRYINGIQWVIVMAYWRRFNGGRHARELKKKRKKER